MASSGNFCTWNPLGAHGGGTTDFGTLSGGNLLCTLGDSAFGNFGVTSGKWYWEWCMTGSAWDGGVGWANQQVNTQAELGYNSPSSATGAQMVYMYLSTGAGNWVIISDAPKAASSGTNVDYSSSLAQDDIIGLAADFDNDKWYMSINGSFTNMRSSQNPATGTNPLCSKSGGGGLVTITRTAGYVWYPAIGNWAAASRPSTVNFGQDSTFGGEITAGGNADGNGFGDFKYSPPSGFLAMCSANLPISDDIDPAQTDDDYLGKQFNAITYTGNGSTQSITGLGFKPDMVWYKRRDTTNPGVIMDSSRGVSEALEPNSTGSADTNFTQGITSFDTDGFSLGSQVQGNGSSGSLIAWCWRANGGTTASNSDGATTATVQANTKSGFSIVEIPNYSGTTTLGHGLSKAPEFIIVKLRASSSQWIVQHTGLAATQIIKLNSSAAAATDDAFNDTAPTSSVFSLGSGFAGSGTAIAYCWHSVEGFSKFGSWTASGNEDGPFIYTGFRPRLLVIKGISATNNWMVFDTARQTFNPIDKNLHWDTADVEATEDYRDFDILSNGFKIRSDNGALNHPSGDEYVYMCWGDVPFKYNNTF